MKLAFHFAGWKVGQVFAIHKGADIPGQIGRHERATSLFQESACKDDGEKGDSK